jgi:hypothetical protein
MSEHSVPQKYDGLIKLNAFLENLSDLQTCFENSLHVFEAFYWKDYEFTKYYVEENLKNLYSKNYCFALRNLFYLGN